MEKLDTLLKKYNNFKGAQIRSIDHLPNGAKLLTLIEQDEDGEDMYSVKVEFTNVTTSKILESSVLPLLDMSSGITLIKENDLYGFGLGSGTVMLHVHNAPLYIIASEIQISEQSY